ncbi:hypothetical protein [Hydrogenoanaerobacterium saccharovorans]|uniref:Lipoprotein n=1 Tax=Hydrogenoanaerobacterium saccharovorans TaxID=474960 RepID=A0A1H8ANZ8_9FIRM|nr:hypothetical protein [Hydrogenoanaerobacterium saccharovorans]SEM71548.1 hypothetical protein SAMN05216180_1414 [Hydrogenoanaerobacterium saccharovorans]
MSKKIIFIMSLLLITVLGACSIDTTKNDKEYTSQELQRLCRIEVYSSEDNSLINTIEDSDILFKFNQWSSEITGLSGEKNEIKEKLEDSESLYCIAAYKSPAALHKDGELEKNITVTIFKDTNMIKVEISPEAIKSFSVPSEYLTFYEDITDEKMQFLISLATSSLNDDKSDSIQAVK